MPKSRRIALEPARAAARTFAPPNSNWSPPTRTSARPKPRSIPSITLTGFYGYQTVALSDLFTGATRAWQFGPADHRAAVHRRTFASEPQIDRGPIPGIRLALSADRAGSVSRSLRRPHRLPTHARILAKSSKQRTEAHRDATDLANVRYEGGVTSYLEVLYNEQELFNAELGLAQAQRDELLERRATLSRAGRRVATNPAHAISRTATKNGRHYE